MKIPLDYRDIFSSLTTNLISWVASLFSLAVVGAAAWFLRSAFLETYTVPAYILYILAVISASLILVTMLDLTKRKGYFIPISGQFLNGSEPNEYGRRNKWNYKDKKKYYYIPLLSFDYNGFLQFRDVCGPYCSRCDHLLCLDGGGEYGREFFCVNCIRKFRIPAELREDYRARIVSYFQEEYRQNKLRAHE